MDSLTPILNSLKVLFPGAAVMAVIVAVFKYLGVRQGHDVAAEHNANLHNEAIIEKLQNFIEETRKADQEARKAEQEARRDDHARLKAMEDRVSEIQEKYLLVREEHAVLKGDHAHCQAEIAGLKAQVQSLIEGLAKEEVRHAAKERGDEAKLRQAEDEKRDQLRLNDHLTSILREHDLLSRIDHVEKTVQQVVATPTPTGDTSVNIHTEAVNVHNSDGIKQEE